MSVFLKFINDMWRKSWIFNSNFIRTFTPKRFFYELKRDGFKLFTKRVWRKLILRGDENNCPSKISLKKLHELVADYNDLKKFSKDNKINYLKLKDFSEIEKLSSTEGVFTVFTGGGLINQKSLENLVSDQKIFSTRNSTNLNDKHREPELSGGNYQS